MLLEACKRLLAQYPGKVSTTFPVYGVDEGFLGARASRPRSQGPITPPSRGSRRSRAGGRRLMRWGGQPIPATLPPVVPLIVTHRAAKADAVGGPTNSRHLAAGSASDRHSQGAASTAGPPSRRLPLQLEACIRRSSRITPPLRGSRRSRAGRRRLMRWGVSGGRLLSKPTCTPWKTAF